MIEDTLLIIDPGHGGNGEPGAVANGYKEKDLNLKRALCLRDLAKKYFKNIIMTRETDIEISVNCRASWVAEKAAQFPGKVICISCHFNACNGKARGVEAIHSIWSKPDLAQCIADLIAELGLPFRRVFSRKSTHSNTDYYAMHRLTGKAQTIISEAGFIDNAEDMALIKQSGFLQKIAEKELEGILKYLKVPLEPTYEHYTISLTHVVELNPIAMKAEIVAGKRPNRNNWVNGNFFNYGNPPTTIGWLISEGKVLSERHEQRDYPGWKGNPKGTVIVYKNGTIECGLKYDNEIEKVLNDIWFCCQGFNLMPLNIKGEGFNPAEVGYSCNRVSLGYNKSKNKLILAVRPSSDAARAVLTMKNLGCNSAICLDSGGSCNLTVNGKALFKTNRALANILYWR